MDLFLPVAGMSVNVLLLLGMGALVGVLAALMGLGGGFFLIPAMTYFLAMPMRIVVGTRLFQMLFTSASVTLMQAVMNRSVDAFLALGLLVGSAPGAQLGARLAKRLRGDQLKIVLALLVLALSFKMFNDLLVMPPHFLAGPGGP